MEMTETKIVVYGTSWCGDCKRTRAYLDMHRIAYEWIDIDRDPNAAAFVEKVNRGFRSVPTVVLLDGSVLVEPSDRELELSLGVEKSSSYSSERMRPISTSNS